MNQKIFLICNAIVRSVVFICITLAAIYFQQPDLLWWYIILLLM